MQVTVCDVCEARPAQTYHVSVDDRSGTTDRCEEHAAPLEEIIEGKPRRAATQPRASKAAPVKKAAKAAPAKRGARRPRVVDISEVEAARR